MNKGIYLGVGALVIGSAAAAPFWFGGQIEAEFQNSIQQLKTSTAFPPWMNVRIDSYEKGWRSSTAQTTLTIDLASLSPPDAQQEMPEAIDITFDHHIKHGPFSDSQLVMAVIESALVLPPEAKEVVSHYFGDDSPFQQTTLVKMDGYSTTQFQIPAYSGRDHTDQADITWQGLNGTVKGQWQSLENNATMQAPLLKINSEKGQFTFKSLKFDGESHYSPEGLNLSDGSLSLDEFTIASQTGPNTTLRDFRISVDSNQNGPLVGASETISFDRLEIEQAFAVGPGELALEIRNMDAETLVKLEERMHSAQQMSSDPNQIGAAIAFAFMELGPELLKSSPEIEISKLNLGTPMGNIESSLFIGFNGEGDYDLQVPPSLIPFVTLDAKANIPTVLLNMAAQQQARSQIVALMEMNEQELSPEELEQQVQQATQQQLAQMEQMNFIVANGASHSAHLHFENGKLSLNGQPADQLLGALPIPQQDPGF